MSNHPDSQGPMAARTRDQLKALVRDNIATRDYWILFDGERGTVTVAHQRTGESAKA